MGSSTRFILLLTTPLTLLHPRPSLLRLTRLSLSPLTLSRPSSLLPIKSTHHHHHHHIHSQAATSSSSSSPLIDDNFGDYSQQHCGFSPNPRASHPWPEWSHLIHALSTVGYFDKHRFGGDGIDDEYVAYENLSDEFVRAASACLAFARNRSDILGSLSRRDIEVIVENGTPFLFKSALDSSRRMRSFLSSGRTNVLESGKAEMVDLMKYLLSYASNPSVSSERNNLYSRDHIESSVRNLLSDLTEMSSRAPMSNLSAPEQYQVSEVHRQTPRPLGQNIEMKRGDWICPKCTFMNFARNNKCLECEEPRPKRQITGGEWECPQCNFFNYGRNMVCLRCDCKRPGEVSLSTANPRPAYNGDYASKAGVHSSRLAANEEKAQRWFTKVSQQNNVSDFPDEDFPEIMPLRKGENRFVVSTRKTPLERRLENSQYQRSSGNENITEGNSNSHQGGGANRTLDASINRSLDQILDPTSSKTDTRLGSPQFEPPRGNNSNFVPFVPLPADMFAKRPQDSEIGDSEKVVPQGTELVPSKSSGPTSPPSVTNSEPVKPGESIVEDKDEAQARKPDRWFKRVAELHDVPDISSSLPNKDLPDIMPMRKGENRFVISKTKDRSFTSPTYKRQMAMQQPSNSKFVPFVPLPPDYFAKKDQKPQPNSTDSTVNFTDESNNAQNTETQPTPMGFGEPGKGNHSTQNSFTSPNVSSYDDSSSRYPVGEKNTFRTEPPGSENMNRSSFSSQPISDNSRKDTNLVGENKNVTSSGWTGKSLEGSAVKEPDPLDMSEEAKAERWFRRVAQIKDISELSQIPDEDFPSIMPMRKGVNRFVVSKRKTPLERRLTSPQYRRNLPIVSSDPAKKENDGK